MWRFGDMIAKLFFTSLSFGSWVEESSVRVHIGIIWISPGCRNTHNHNHTSYLSHAPRHMFFSGVSGEGWFGSPQGVRILNIHNHTSYLSHDAPCHMFFSGISGEGWFGSPQGAQILITITLQQTSFWLHTTVLSMQLKVKQVIKYSVKFS